ncbi:nucleoporin p58/p45 [Blastomyces parvus]|uniref:Nucleoporin p58/p45 n=1 Tax=Blastomyces parvus TaxID=2060905 RepID=A0A2B7WVU0_9EURO|nr:nucleoporin p58/p45 [Blastomyces parvus]
MFSARTSAPSLGGLTVNTSSANSLFGANTTSTAPTTTTGGNLFGAAATNTQPQQPQSGGLFSGLGTQNQQQQKPAGGSLFGAASQQTQPASGNPFGSTQPQSGASLFGAGTQQQQQQQQPQQSGGLFGATQQKPAGGSLFGAATSTSQPQSGGSLFSGLGQAATTTSTSTGGLFGASQPQQQQQQQPQPQPQQGPSLSLFGNRNMTAQSQQRPAGSTVQGVKIDVSNLVPTTKFESCTDELKREIETIDTFILNQIRMCNEVSDILPTIASQGALVPNDVEFVQGKLDTLQEALENDARGIENARNLVTRDAGEAKLAFRALDTLLLPLQYQHTAADRWLPPNQQSQPLPGRSIRSGLNARHMLALPEDAEADSSLGATGGPTNLVDYFSQRADDMDGVVQKYRKSLKEIEDYLRGVETSLSQQISDLSSRTRDGGAPSHTSATRTSELAATLGDVETAILGVAGRVGGLREEVQELVLGPLGIGGNGITNGW